MERRRLGKTGFEVTEVSLGTWQVGGKWGSGFDDALAESILEAAIDQGVNFIDTADVYENRQSEAAVARVVKRRSERVYVATKCGRFISPHVNEGYTVEALRGYVESSLRNTGLETLDLVQLHCPPTDVYYRPEIFGLFDDLKSEGKVLNLGVSVEKVEEALKAIEFANVTTVQIIFNMFRQRPAERFFAEAKRRDVGIIVRVPWPAGCSPASSAGTRNSTKATIGISIEMVQHSTEVKRSLEFPTKQASTRSTSCARCSQIPTTWPDKRCAGCSTSTRCRPSSPEHRVSNK